MRRKKFWLKAGAAALILAAPIAVGLNLADAAVRITAGAEFKDTTIPGETAPATFRIINNSDEDEAAFTATVTDLRLIPSCGEFVPDCPDPALQEPGVFQLNGPFVGTGSPGAVCPTSYTATVIDPATGKVEFTPVGAPPMLDVGESCTISFTTTTLRVPSFDAEPATPGVQTAQIGSAFATLTNGRIGLGSGTSSATVLQAPATIATTAAGTDPTTPQQIDQTDIVTVVVTDDDGTTATDTDDATVTITPPEVIPNVVTPPAAPPAAPRLAALQDEVRTLARTGASLYGMVALAVSLLAAGGMLLLGGARWAPAALAAGRQVLGSRPRTRRRR